LCLIYTNQKNLNMKKTLMIAFIALITLNGNALFAMSPAEAAAEENLVVNTEKETYTAEDIQLIAERVEEIRDMEKSGMTSEVRKAVKYELMRYKEIIQSMDPFIYIGGSGLLLLIIILIIIF